MYTEHIHLLYFPHKTSLFGVYLSRSPNSIVPYICIYIHSMSRRVNRTRVCSFSCNGHNPHNNTRIRKRSRSDMTFIQTKHMAACIYTLRAHTHNQTHPKNTIICMLSARRRQPNGNLSLRKSQSVQFAVRQHQRSTFSSAVSQTSRFVVLRRWQPEL